MVTVIERARGGRDPVRLLLIGLAAWEIIRLCRAAYALWSGVSPAYSGRYQGRILNSIVGGCLMGAALAINQDGAMTRKRRWIYWPLFIVAVIAFAVDIVTSE